MSGSPWIRLALGLGVGGLGIGALVWWTSSVEAAAEAATADARRAAPEALPAGGRAMLALLRRGAARVMLLPDAAAAPPDCAPLLVLPAAGADARAVPQLLRPGPPARTPVPEPWPVAGVVVGPAVADLGPRPRAWLLAILAALQPASGPGAAAGCPVGADWLQPAPGCEASPAARRALLAWRP